MNLKTIAVITIALTWLCGGVVGAFLLAYNVAKGDPHWTVMMGCPWATAWMLFNLLTVNAFVLIITHRKTNS